MTEQPNREVTLLNAALELPAQQRAAYLDEACAGEPANRVWRSGLPSVGCCPWQRNTTGRGQS
jgi:hypothetical protein